MFLGLSGKSEIRVHMFQLINPLFSRRVAGKASEIIPVDGCHVNYSSVFSFQGKGTSRCYSLKYVVNGLEDYEVNGKRHKVMAGNYLVVAQGSDISIKIESKQLVEGVRFFVPEYIIKDIWGTLNTLPEKLLDYTDPDQDLPLFFENKFGSNHDDLGRFMMQIGNLIKENHFTAGMIDDTLFYKLGLELCKQQNIHLQNLQAIPAQKKSTREELYRRLLATRDYIQDCFTKPITLNELAQFANISEFHYLRSFKSIFGESPYRYLLTLRMQLAQDLLLKEEMNIKDIALVCGFNEVQSFTKLFRKEFGVGPTSIVKALQK